MMLTYHARALARILKVNVQPDVARRKDRRKELSRVRTFVCIENHSIAAPLKREACI
jgi:hypothetical protein